MVGITPSRKNVLFPLWSMIWAGSCRKYLEYSFSSHFQRFHKICVLKNFSKTFFQTFASSLQLYWKQNPAQEFSRWNAKKRPSNQTKFFSNVICFENFLSLWKISLSFIVYLFNFPFSLFILFEHKQQLRDNIYLLKTAIIS